MAGRLTGRIAVITGASGGIGQATARKLASEGADIAVADIIPAEETRGLVEANGRRFFSAKVDISDEEQIRGFADQVREALGPADIVVNNAVAAPLGDIDNVTYEQWRQTFSVNVDGAFLTTRAFLDHLKRSPAGRVINMASASYWKAPPSFVAYISSKAAIHGLTHALATNLAPYEVTANAVAPSLVRTAKAVRILPQEFFDEIAQQQDLKRSQTPEDVANTIAFLASDEAAFITGQIIAVDGGFTRR